MKRAFRFAPWGLLFLLAATGCSKHAEELPETAADRPEAADEPPKSAEGRVTPARNLVGVWEEVEVDTGAAKENAQVMHLRPDGFKVVEAKRTTFGRWQARGQSLVLVDWFSGRMIRFDAEFDLRGTDLFLEVEGIPVRFRRSDLPLSNLDPYGDWKTVRVWQKHLRVPQEWTVQRDPKVVKVSSPASGEAVAVYPAPASGMASQADMIRRMKEVAEPIRAMRKGSELKEIKWSDWPKPALRMVAEDSTGPMAFTWLGLQFPGEDGLVIMLIQPATSGVAAEEILLSLAISNPGLFPPVLQQ